MIITEFSRLNDKESMTERIRECDWSAAKFLAQLLEKGCFNSTLGKGTLVIVMENDELAAFATLTEKDCINDDALFPWIGFVFTTPLYRGRRLSGKIIDYACKKARSEGYDRVYLATDHTGLYEKYGFSYMENRIDIYGGESRIYVRELKADSKEILRSFLDSEERLTAYPAKRKMKLHALIYLGGKLQKDRVYSEKEINALLNEWHTFGDPATLRRELYNHRFLNRDSYGKEYRAEENMPTYEELEKRYG